MAAALGAAVVYGAAYPATAIALRSFSPLAIAGAFVHPRARGRDRARGGRRPPPTRTRRDVVRARMAARRLERPRWHRLHRRREHRGRRERTDDHGIHRAAVRGPRDAVRRSTPRREIRVSTLVAFLLAFVGTALLARTVPSGEAAAGVVIALGSAAMFGLYLVLARRWGVRYRLDGTLVTIANLVGRGPILLVAALLLEPGRVVPAAPDAAAVVALLTIAFGSSMTGNLLLMASVRRDPCRPNLDSAAADPGRVGGDRGDPARRAACTGRGRGSVPDPRRDDSRQRGFELATRGAATRLTARRGRERGRVTSGRRDAARCGRTPPGQAARGATSCLNGGSRRTPPGPTAGRYGRGGPAGPSGCSGRGRGRRQAHRILASGSALVSTAGNMRCTLISWGARPRRPTRNAHRRRLPREPCSAFDDSAPS